MRVLCLLVALVPPLSLAGVAGAAPPCQTSAEPANVIPEVVFIPTPDDVVDGMLRLAGVQSEDVVYDLGCGDGRILVRAAKQYGCRAVGCDIDPLRVRSARASARHNGVEKLVTIHQQDLFAVDLRDTTVVMLYLSTKYNARLVPQLDRLRPGSRIVSHLFEIPGIQPDRVVSLKSKVDGRTHNLFLWTTPLKHARGP
jgi:SAM-dependent methyltransferase